MSPSAHPRRSLSMSNAVLYDPEEDDNRQQHETDHCGSVIAICEGNSFRIFWDILMATVLFYTGTIFLYRLAFVSNHAPVPEDEDGFWWELVNWTVNITFYIDLLASFLFTFRDRHGEEVDSLRLIALNYLGGVFWINLLACIPESFWRLVFVGIFSSSDEQGESKANQGLQALKIQRVTRLARLLRISRLGKLVSISKNNSLVRRFKEIRGVQSSSFLFLLFFVVHVLACGWYLCASLHDNHEHTWLYRRVLYEDTELGPITVLQASHFEQYMSSFYFVLTVFTTVGFGDISASTPSEICYVCIVMLLGAVVHSMVINEVIVRVKDGSELSRSIAEMNEMLDGFAQQTQLSEKLEDMLKDWVYHHAQEWHSDRYDRRRMKQTISGKIFPGELLAELPDALFRGRLVANNFISWMQVGSLTVPPRLALLLATSLTLKHTHSNEIIYQYRESAFYMMLVCSGTFAAVGLPGMDGGRDAVEPKPDLVFHASSAKKVKHLALKAGSNLLSLASRDSRDAFEIPDEMASALYPYDLYSHKSYFGHVELMLGGLRRSTVRCESAGGELLILKKDELHELEQQFPECDVFWVRMAVLHEWMRQQRLARLTNAMTWRNRAAYTIQRQFRIMLRYRGGDNSPSPRRRKLPAVASDFIGLLETHLAKRNEAHDLAHRLSTLETKVDRNFDALNTKVEIGFRAILQHIAGKKDSSSGEDTEALGPLETEASLLSAESVRSI
eukprot:TRINITY_DN53455_c0_g1_i1.p1 TRINITY_DN53455_c0_g1~~TRINITY_DN53455_c0_g1_i1.p1  ORF type:complete len:731 (-),score=95.69 TRINITY_DN53455_c0_g1_i1:41-2233(-)